MKYSSAGRSRYGRARRRSESFEIAYRCPASSSSRPRFPTPMARPHIGHAYERIATDAIARFKRLDGYETFCSSPAWTSMARKCSRRPRGKGSRRIAARRPHGGAIRGDGRGAERARRRHRSHDGGAPPPRRAGDLAAHGGGRRHLSVEISGLVLGPRRGLLRRIGADRRTATGSASRRAARRSNGSRRRAIISGFRPIRTGCSRIIATIPNS